MIALYQSKKTKRFYLYAGLLALTGWLWLFWSLTGSHEHNVTLCFFKNITGQPCPACGSTTAVLMLLQGDWLGALYANPFGYVVTVGLLALPLWVATDLLTHKPTLQNTVARFDAKIRQQPWLFAIILLPVILNWIWNIMKM